MSRNTETVALLEALAHDEVMHCREFTRLYDQACARKGACPEADESYDSETSAYLTAIAADVVFSSGLMALRQFGFEDPHAVLTYAIASEKDSILFYTELAAHSRDEEARSAFMEITRQERGHLARLMARLDALGPKE